MTGKPMTRLTKMGFPFGNGMGMEMDGIPLLDFWKKPVS
jgi:hypothetical protein